MKSYTSVIITLIFTLCTLSYSNITLPSKPKGAVVDDASVLTSETRSNLSLYAADIYKKTGVSIIFYSIETAENSSMQKYAEEVYKKWGLGNENSNSAILVLTSLKEKNFLICPGEGILEVVNNQTFINISKNSFDRFFSKDNWDLGISCVYSQIAESIGVALNKEPYIFLAYSEKYKLKDNRAIPPKNLALFLFLLILIILFFLVALLLKNNILANKGKGFSEPSGAFGGEPGRKGFGLNRFK